MKNNERSENWAILFMACIIGFAVLPGMAMAVTAPAEEWNKSYGGTGYDFARSVHQTTDGGYIFAGYTDSYLPGNNDAWLVKTYANGTQEWDKAYPGANSDFAFSIEQTSDGGYVVAGQTWSYGAGNGDAYLFKTYADGTQEWAEVSGGTGYDYVITVQQTSDGGYIFAGSTTSFGAGNYDAWLIKTYPNGTQEWNRTFGGVGRELIYSVHQTSDGGYIMAGATGSYGAGNDDAWLVKTYPNGTQEWSKVFGGSGYDFASSVQQTSDGGYILAGFTASYGAGSNDAWLIKTYPNGTQQWSKTFGGSGYDSASSVQQTSDNGYILACTIESNGYAYATLIKTYSDGTQEWNKTFEKLNSEAQAAQQTSDNGYILTGHGNGDAWLIKVASDAIAPSTIEILFPNAISNWQIGGSQNIEWTYTGTPGSTVKIELFKGFDIESLTTLESNAPIGSDGTGSYLWSITPPEGIDYLPGPYQIKITASDGSTTDTSGFFNLNNPPITTLSGIITHIMLDPDNPPMYRGKTGTPSYPLALRIYNPNDIEKTYQVGIKSDFVDESNPSGSMYMLCIPSAEPSSYTVSVTVPAKGTNDVFFTCMSEWDWIPPQKGGFFEEFMKNTGQTIFSAVAEEFAKYNPITKTISLVEFWMEIVKAANLIDQVEGQKIHPIELNSGSSTDLEFDPSVNQYIVAEVPTIKWILLGSSVFNEIASSGAVVISEASLSTVPNPVSVGIWIAGILADNFAAIQYQQAYDPDHNYTTVQAPIPIHFSEMDTMPDGDAKKFVSAYADAVSLRNATLVAYIRYDGARIDNQSEYMLMQLEAANNFTLQAIQKMSEAVGHYKLMTASIEPMTDEQVQQFRERIQTDGLSQETKDFLTRNGYGDNIENITQVILKLDPEFYRNPRNYTKFLDIQTAFMAYESRGYMSEIVRIKVEEKGYAVSTASDADITHLEELKSQINQSINDGTVTPGTQVLINEMIGKSREVLDETNNLAYMPYYEFAVSALAILPALDNTPPEITITTPANGTSYILNQNVLANWQTSDPGSGIDSVTATVPNGTAIDTVTVGTKSFSVNASDKSGNQANETVSYDVVYNFSGLTVSTKGKNDIIRLGSSVLVSFQLKDANQNTVSTATAKIYTAKVTNGNVGTETEGTSSDRKNPGNQFKYNSKTKQYEYNLATRTLTAGTWQIRIGLDDETSKYTTIVLK